MKMRKDDNQQLYFRLLILKNDTSESNILNASTKMDSLHGSKIDEFKIMKVSHHNLKHLKNRK